MPPKTGFNTATEKGTHNLGMPPPPPVYDPIVGYEDFASVKGKSTGDSNDDSSDTNN